MKELIWIRKNLGLVIGIFAIACVYESFKLEGFWLGLAFTVIIFVCWKLISMGLNLMFYPLINYIMKNSIPIEEKPKMSKIKSSIIYGREENLKD